jgi:hypothetical protein
VGVLNDYRTWDNLVQFYPSFKGLKPIAKALVNADSYESWSWQVFQAGVKLPELNELLTKYVKTDRDRTNLRRDLGTLMGVGKGTNQNLKLMGSFYAKYDDRYVADMEDAAFVKKMERCVKLARWMVTGMLIKLDQRALAGQNNVGFGIFDQAFLYHFNMTHGFEPNSWKRVHEVYSKAKAGLDGVFRLAALHANEAVGVSGIVCEKRITKGQLAAGVSPNKVVHTTSEKYDMTDFAIVSGSIHIDYDRFRTPAVEKNEIRMPEPMVASCIVHEATHRWALTDDEGKYFWQGRPYRKSDDKKKLNNADCYAAVALSVSQNFVVKELADLNRMTHQ